MVFKILIRIILAVMVLLISGCDRQPPVETLQKEIAQTLEQDFKHGLFELVSIRRLGSTRYNDANTGDKRLTVYFNAQLKFREAFDLTSWDGLNGASIAFVLGATEQGVNGIRQGGNNENDILRVHGSRVYALRYGEWRALPTAHRKSITAEKATESQRLIKHIRELSERSTGRLGGTEQMIIDKELTLSIKRIERALDRQSKIFSVASASPQGAYYRYIQSLEDNAKKLGFSVHNYPTQGSVENCLLVQSKSVDIAIAQSNITSLAAFGDGPFKQHGPLSGIRAISALFPEYTQLVVANKANIQNLNSLKGKRIDIGLPESGTRLDSLRVLDAADLTLPDFKEIHESDLDLAVKAIQSGKLDAFFTTLQAPGHALQDLLASGEAQLLSLPDKVQQKMLKQYGVYRTATLPAYTYPKQNKPISTLGLTATLIAHSELPDAQVVQLLDGLFSSIPIVAKTNLRVTLLSTQIAREGITIPLHPAAEHYLNTFEKTKRK